MTQKYLNYHLIDSDLKRFFNKTFFGIFDFIMKHSSSKKQIELLLLFVILIGLILRFWRFTEIPFMFDELSAMSRTTFKSFSELIKIGVIEKDSHPAGIQVFLYYWSILFGESEFVIKLPFLLAGLSSIYLSYRIGEIWFGKSVGTLTAVYICSLQLFIMYSQIARPYISGLFFTLFAVLYWSKYFFISSKTKYLFGFIVFAVLAAYNHYFSLLFVTVVGLSGLILVNRKNIVSYIVSGVAILILYIPHLTIIFAQAEKGTIGGWLGAPGPLFLFKFLYWLFHKSFYSITVFILIFIVGIVFNKISIQSKNLNKKRILMILWLIPAPVFGYIYSLNVEPILQNSLLIFTTPYLFILLFSYTGEWKFRNLTITVVVILLVNSLTLISTQHYYKVFYHQPFNQLVRNAIKIEAENKDDVLIINDNIPYFTEYYFRKYDKHLPYLTMRNTDITIADLKQKISETEKKIIITSGIDDIYFQVIMEQFPYWIGYEHGFTYEQYVFSKVKNEDNKIFERKLVTQTSFKKDENARWQYNANSVQIDPISDDYFYLMKVEEEYGPKFEIPLNELIDDIYWIIDVEIELKTDDTEMNAIIVGEIKNGDELVHWQGSGISEFGIEPGKWQKAFLTMDIQKALQNQNNIDDKILRFYLWNRDHKQFMIRKIKVFLRQGNPERYML